MKNRLLIFIALLSFFSCKKENLHLPSVVLDYDRTLLTNNEMGPYTNYFNGIRNGNISYELGRTNEQEPNGIISAAYFEEVSELEPINGGDFYINEYKVAHTPNIAGFYAYHLEGVSLIPQEYWDAVGEIISTELLGKDIEFRFVRDNEEIFNETLYIPSEFYITNVSESKVRNTPSYWLDRNGTEINFPADPNEQSTGIMLKLTWRGLTDHMTFEDFQDYEPTDISRAAWYKHDNGTIILNNELVNGIPKGAIVTITFYRANTNVIIGTDNQSYYINGESTHQLSFVIKN